MSLEKAVTVSVFKASNSRSAGEPSVSEAMSGRLSSYARSLCKVIRDVALVDKGRLLNDIQMALLSLSRTQN